MLGDDEGAARAVLPGRLTSYTTIDVTQGFNFTLPGYAVAFPKTRSLA